MRKAAEDGTFPGLEPSPTRSVVRHARTEGRLPCPPLPSGRCFACIRTSRAMPMRSATASMPVSAALRLATACADACLAEKHVERLITCIRLNQDCAAVCTATGNHHRRAPTRSGTGNSWKRSSPPASPSAAPAPRNVNATRELHKHCEVCAKVCTALRRRLHRNAVVDAHADVTSQFAQARGRARRRSSPNSACASARKDAGPAAADRRSRLRVEACGEITARVDQIAADHRELDTGRQRSGARRLAT